MKNKVQIRESVDRTKTHKHVMLLLLLQFRLTGQSLGCAQVEILVGVLQL